MLRFRAIPDGRYRVLLVATHPVQYAAPQFRLLAQHPRLDIQVAYCTLQGAEAGVDPEFGVEVAWDVPLLEGYPWVHVPNRALRPGLGRFWGLFNPGLWRLVRSGEFDAVVTYTGYAVASFWMVLAAAKLGGTPLLFGTDATSVRSRDAARWKSRVKPWLWRRVFGMADQVLAPSAAGAAMFGELGIPPEKITLTPFVADNAWWTRQSERVNRAAVRASWDIPQDATVVLFCAKLQPWKRPPDALRAFAQAGVAGTYLVFAGEGPMRVELEAEARTRGIADRVRFLGFVNQSQLPATYTAADVFVLPSEYDPCPVVVCEAMLCGCPVILSDAIRGRFDLVQPGGTGFIYPCGNLDALAGILRELLVDRAEIAALSAAARERMKTWSPRENLAGTFEAIEKAAGRRAPREVQATA